MERPRILIVEDESVIAMSIRQILEAQGYQVIAAVPSGEQAVDLAVAERPDLILMDVVLKGEMDGTAAAERIRSIVDIPVVYLTAYADDETLRRARATAPFGYLIKPFEERELCSTIDMALYRAEMERREKERREWLNTAMNSIMDALVAADTSGRITFMNAAAEEIIGWNRHEAVGADAAEIFAIRSEAAPALVENPVRSVLRDRSAVALPDGTILITRSGEEVSIEGHAAPIIPEDGALIGAIVAFRDITLRKQAEAELQRHRRHLEELVQERTDELQRLLQYIETTERKAAEESLNTSMGAGGPATRSRDPGIITIDAEGEIVLINPAAEQLTGYRREEASGNPLQRIVTVVDRRTGMPVEDLLSTVRSGENGTFSDLALITRSGDARPILLASEPISGEDGSTIGLILSIHED